MNKHAHNTLGVITARGGSKGIPGKNIKALSGKPLIAYTIDAASKSALITHCIVSTDDEEIAAVCREHDAEVPFIRPKELAEDSTPHLPTMQHAVSFMEDITGVQFDYVVILQPTSPFRTPEDIDGTIQKLIDTNADSAVSVCAWEGPHPIKAKKLEGDLVLPYFVNEDEGRRRQDLPPAYKRSGAVYATRRDVLVNHQSLYGDRIAGYVVPAERSIDIDTPLDWAKAEWMLEDLTRKGFAFFNSDLS